MYENWTGEIKIRLGIVPHIPKCTPIVDAETSGKYFYEEVQSHRRAELIVEAWNHLYASTLEDKLLCTKTTCKDIKCIECNHRTK